MSQPMVTREQRVESIMRLVEEGYISTDDAHERILVSDEAADDKRRRSENIG